MTNDKLPVEFGEEEARLPATFGTVKVVKDPTGAGKGKSPYIGENGTWMEYDDGSGAYIDTGVAATGPAGPAGKDGKDGTPGKDGADGKNGVDGITPHIGSNGNWWIGETDTGVSAEGKAAEGGVNFTTDESLTLDPETGVLSVNTAEQVEADNTLPITSAAVHTVVGNIEALLKTI